MKNKLKIVLLIVICILLFGIFQIYAMLTDKVIESRKSTVASLAFNHTKSESVVYIQELSEYVPYLVLTDCYHKNATLLLRKYLNEKEMPYSLELTASGTYAGYYAKSNVDRYLNDEFISRYSKDLISIINDTPIDIATMQTVGNESKFRKTETINRKIFLLSAKELNIRTGMDSREGTALNYFKNQNHFIATTSEEIPDAYWLRSAYLWDDHQAWVIGADGTYGGTLTNFEFKVRPAFTIPSSTKIKKEYNVELQKEIYILDI